MSQLNDAWSWGQDSSETNEDNSGSTDPIDWDDNNSWGTSWDNNETIQTESTEAFNNEKINKTHQHITQHNQQGTYDNHVNTAHQDGGYRSQQYGQHKNHNNNEQHQYQYHQYQQEQHYINSNNGNYYQHNNVSVDNGNIHYTPNNANMTFQNGGIYAQQQTGYAQYNNHNMDETNHTVYPTNNQNSWYPHPAAQTGTYQQNQTSYEQVQSPHQIQNVTEQNVNYQNIVSPNVNANHSDVRQSVSPSVRNVNNLLDIQPQAQSFNYEAENNEQPPLVDNVENIATTPSISLGGKNSWYQDEYNNVSDSFNHLSLNQDQDQGNELNQLPGNEVSAALGGDTSVPFNQETLDSNHVNYSQENVDTNNANNVIYTQEPQNANNLNLNIQENVELTKHGQQEQVPSQSDANDYAFNDIETNADQIISHEMNSGQTLPIEMNSEQTLPNEINSGQTLTNEMNCAPIETVSDILPRTETVTSNPNVIQSTEFIQNTDVIQNVDSDDYSNGLSGNNMPNQTENLGNTVEIKTENIRELIENTEANGVHISNTVEVNSVIKMLQENVGDSGGVRDVLYDKTANTVELNTIEDKVDKPNNISDISESITPPIPTDSINAASSYENISDRNIEVINNNVVDNQTHVQNKEPIKITDILKGGPKKYMSVTNYNQKFGHSGVQSNASVKDAGKADDKINKEPKAQNKANEDSKAQDRISFSSASDKLSRLRRSTEKTTKDRNQYLETGELRDSRSPSDEDEEDEAPSFVRMIPGSEMSDPNQTQPNIRKTTIDKSSGVKKSLKTKRVRTQQPQPQDTSQPSESASADEEEEEERDEQLDDKKLMKIIQTIMSEEKAKKKEKVKKTGGKDSLESTALRIAKLLKAQKLSPKAVTPDSDSDHAELVKEEEEEHNASFDSQPPSLKQPSHPSKAREGGGGGSGGLSHFEMYLQSMAKRKDRPSKPSIASSSPIPLEERHSSTSLMDKSQRYTNDRYYHDSTMSLLDKSQKHYSERSVQRPFPQRTPPTKGGYPDRPYPQRTPPTQGGYPDRPFPQRTPPTQGYPDRPFPQRTPPLQSDRYPDRSYSQQGGGGGPPSFSDRSMISPFTDSSTLERRRKVSGDSFANHIPFLDSILANFPAVTTADKRQRMTQLSLAFPLEYNAWYRERYMPILERYKEAVNERKLILRNRVTKQFGRHCVGKSRLNGLLKFEGRNIHEYNIDVEKAFHQTEDSNFLDDIELLTPFTFDNEDRKCFYGFVQSMIHRATSLSEQLLYQLIELKFKSKGEVELSDIGDLLLRSYSKVRGLQYLHYPDTLLWKSNNSSEINFKLRQHTVNDQKQKAFQLALQSKDWALASVLASAPNSCLSQAELHQAFLSTIPANDPLRPCFQMMFNQSVQVNSHAPIDLNDWGIHLAAILNNSTQDTLDTTAVLKLGQLLGDKGDYYGEQFCTLIVTGASWSRFKLLGAPCTDDPASVGLAEIVTGRNILLSMACENASKLGPQPASSGVRARDVYQFVELQYMKYYFSVKLLRLGKTKLAVHFLHHAVEEVLSHLREFCTPKHLPLLEQIVDLATLCAGADARGLLWYSQLLTVLEQHLPSRRLTLAPLSQPDPPRRDSNPGPSYSSDPQYSYGDTGPLSLNGAALPTYETNGPQSLPYNGAPGVSSYEGNGRPPSVSTYGPYGGLPKTGSGFQEPMRPPSARQTPVNNPAGLNEPLLNPMTSNPLGSGPQGMVTTGVHPPQEPLNYSDLKSNPVAPRTQAPIRPNPLRNTRAPPPPASKGSMEPNLGAAPRPAPAPQSQYFTPAVVPDAQSSYQQHLQDSESSTSMNVVSLNSSFSYAQEDQKSDGGSNSQSISAVSGKPPSGANAATSGSGGGWFGFFKKNNPPGPVPAQNNVKGQQDSSQTSGNPLNPRAPTPSQYPAPSYSAPPSNSEGGFMQPYSGDYSNPGQSSFYQPQQQSYSRSSSPASSLSTEVRYYTSRRPSWNQQYRYAPR
ncbi:hypothetical protein WDU94_012835 [Cyamophila willieti]